MENQVAATADNPLPYSTMEQFLRHIERRAFHMARLSTGQSEAAMDIVQDSMYKLVEKYSEKQVQDWKPLFYRILSSRLTDYYRRKAVRDRVFSWSKSSHSGEAADAVDPIERAASRNSETPDEMLMRSQRIHQLNNSVQQLPNRQRQAFMLRCWEGLSTADTATAMAISEGSVKTHYSRAMHALRNMLEDYRHD
ncbi:MAG: RNA polymerase sigma factor [Porticoccaceae bacterium]